jgi:hypothetical protein
MKLCPQCQTEYDDTKNFCRRDGTPLETPPVKEGPEFTGGETCPQCGKPMFTEEWFCDHCGAKSEKSSRSSHTREKTGSNLLQQPRSTVARYYEQLSPEKREFQRGAALGFGAAFLVVLGIVGYQHSSSSSTGTPITSVVLETPEVKIGPPPGTSGLSGEQPRNAADIPSPSAQAAGERSLAAAPLLEGQPPGSPSLSLSSKTASEPQEVEVPQGTYRVITPTPLRSEPRDDAPVVTQLKSGIRIKVVGAVGDYLEVTSTKGRAPGYVLKAYTTLVQREK